MQQSKRRSTNVLNRETAGLGDGPDLRRHLGFVGRSMEMASVELLIDELVRGRAGGLLVQGAPGVGKTRLMTEAANLAGARGVRVARAGCLPLTMQLPFDPVVGLLRSLGVPVQDAARESTRELFGLVLQGLEQASLAGPLLLSIDDLQWSDSATIDFVHYCLARLTDVPIGWLLAARLGRHDAVRTHRLQREGLIERVSLEPLSREETRRLIRGVLGNAELSESMLEAVFERTGGNPFLCVELLKAVGVTGAADGGGRASQLAASLVPAAVDDAIEERALRLSPAAQTALDWAAIFPEPLSFGELEAVGGAAVGSAPEELGDAGFLIPAGPSRWSFSHSLVRDAVYARVSQAERVRRHGIVADLLASGPLERLAPQLAHARRWNEAADAYCRLGEAALNRGQGGDAAMLYEHAQELATEARAHGLVRSAKAGRVLALLRAERDEEARRLALELREDLAVHADSAERLTFLARYARALLFGRDVADVEAAQQALEEAAPLFAAADGKVLAEALEARAFVTLQTPNATLAIADAERAAKLARRHRDVAVEARAVNSLAYAMCRSRGAAEGIAILQRALRLAAAAELPADIATARLRLGYMAEAVGDLPEATEHLRRGLEVTGAPTWMTAHLQSTLGLVLAHIGDLDGALAHGLAALRQAARVGSRTETRVAIHTAFAHLYRGELAAARRLLEAHPGPAESFEYFASLEAWGLLLEEEGHPEEALGFFHEGAEIDDIGSLWCAAGAARTAFKIGQLGSAQAALARLEERVGRWPFAGWLCDEARGWVAAGEGRQADAVSRFHAAAGACTQAVDSIRLRLEAALIASARDEIRAAIVDFDTIGAARSAERARASARALGMRPGRRRAHAGALTGREREVAQLIATGYTNAEIAGALYLSPRTVERHVGKILTKLGYRSRIQIAADAAAGKLPGAAPGTP